MQCAPSVLSQQAVAVPGGSGNDELSGDAEGGSMIGNRLEQWASGGLYEPSTERSACGIGFIASLNGQRSHAVVQKALGILVNLEHRGAAGCDPRTGDGAGILIQLPHAFLADVAAETGIRLPAPDEYGTGLVFLPTGRAERQRCEENFAAVVREEGQHLLGWRDVPICSEAVGWVAREVEPVIRQVFVARGRGTPEASDFERKLYVIRKRMERWTREAGLIEASRFYIPSLSARTLAYKGLMLAAQIHAYFPDLADPSLTSGLALVHQRYSTNTFPTWDLAQPFRFLCHNGEINTLRGNLNWMHAREKLFESPRFGDDIAKILPIVNPGASDSAALDNAIELLYHTGRSLSHSVAMLIPEAWQRHETMSDAKKAFYEYHSCLMEPWDGPASIAFTDGKVVGAVLDRNGLRPSRYTVTRDGFVVMASETGVVDIDPENVQYKGRLQPGRMLLVDTDAERIVPDEEIKEGLAARQPYRHWLDANLAKFADECPGSEPIPCAAESDDLQRCQKAFGYTQEDLRLLMGPMAVAGTEPIGSMGNDTPLAVLSDQAPLLYDYFKQLFAQVTNPPLDAIREELVTSTITNLGAEQNLFEEGPAHARQLRLEQPILTARELAALCRIDRTGFRSRTLPILFEAAGGESALREALNELCEAASRAVIDGATLLILSDRGVHGSQAGVPALLAVSAVHHALIRRGLRTRCGLIVDSGEPREVHHFALLLAYGAGAIHPYLAFETLADLHARDQLVDNLTATEVERNYVKAINKGVVKIMSKMGISTLHSYRGAQVFEAVGLSPVLIDRYFSWTASRVGGIDLDVIAEEVRRRHAQAYPRRASSPDGALEAGGQYQWRRRGEYHQANPATIAKLQQSVRQNNAATYQEYADLVNHQNRQLCTLRGLLEFTPSDRPIPIEEVEPAREIVKRFKTGAMSFGSISFEAHANLAIAMNRIGGRSNTGEGGEDPIRYRRFDDAQQRNGVLKNLSDWTADNVGDGDTMRSAIKQIASGRFGVTSEYLVNADELQIKMAQGAKPGEGGQLPGEKVDEWIGRTRYATPGVGLISPPPHHDIYSIEDLAQLIHDLKNANRRARVSVKLVAEVGVGTVAAGVAKAKADVVLISGHDGGTGASPLTSIKHAGLPWELGLAETHQVLLANDLRSRIAVEVDGQLKTGRDVAVACLLGAEEFGFATAPLIASGCVMMRKCHLNTCPVGVATQDPELRKKFAGKPEHVINFMFFVAEELRRIMASLGFRTIDAMVGRSDKLALSEGIDHWKARTLDFTRILHRPAVPAHFGTYCQQGQDHRIDGALDTTTLLPLAAPAIETGQRVAHTVEILNTYRTIGTITGSEITRRWGSDGLPEDTVHFMFKGSAGQSFGAFTPRGMTLEVEGDANDYFGKGLSGAKLIVYPPRKADLVAEKNILIGNVALYGATDGQAYVRGQAGERFAVRNSGARAVVEGVGDHGCEYMTGGRVAVLGPTGRNFAAGMSGGIAFVLDEAGDFGRHRCNLEMVALEPVVDAEDLAELHALIMNHVRYTNSTVARRILVEWESYCPMFVKVMPHDYKRVLAQRKALAEAVAPSAEKAVEVTHG